MCPFLISKGCEWGRWNEGNCSTSCDEDEMNQRRSRKKFKDCNGGKSPEEIDDPNADCTECKMKEEWKMDAEECVYNETCVRGE